MRMNVNLMRMKEQIINDNTASFGEKGMVKQTVSQSAAKDLCVSLLQQEAIPVGGSGQKE